jgi:hypothetical protein
MHSEVNPSPAMMSAGCDLLKEVGDIVKLGPNAGPDYEIVHIAGQTAWIRQPVSFKGEALVNIDRLRFVRAAAPALELAA